MPTVRCPKCARALALPEEHAGATVRCPLCGTAFTGIELPRRGGPSSLPPVSRSEDGDPTTARRSRWGLSPQQRQRLEGAALLLKWTAGLGACQALAFCFCCGPIVGTIATSFVGDVPLLAVGLLGALLALGLIYAGAESMLYRRSHSLALFGCILAFFLATCLTLLTAGTLLSVLDRAPSNDGQLLVLLWTAGNGVVALLGFVGGIRGMVALSGQDVREAFRE